MINKKTQGLEILKQELKQCQQQS